VALAKFFIIKDIFFINVIVELGGKLSETLLVAKSIILLSKLEELNKMKNTNIKRITAEDIVNALDIYFRKLTYAKFHQLKVEFPYN